jgi:hypothetical protein
MVSWAFLSLIMPHIKQSISRTLSFLALHLLQAFFLEMTRESFFLVRVGHAFWLGRGFS